MSTPLTDSINALTAYANETTGASDTTLSDAVGRLCEGYGEKIPSATPEGMKAYFEEQGFVFSDFVFSKVGTGYMSVSHNLGSTPTEIIAFRKVFENNVSSYQFGATCSGAINNDSVRNRTFCIAFQDYISGNDIVNEYLDTIISDNRYPMAVFPVFLLLSNKNFCRSATLDTVEIRNQNSDIARPLLGEWWLGVR